MRAELRVAVKRILRKYGYPRDLQVQATQTVTEQGETLSEGWAVGGASDRTSDMAPGIELFHFDPSTRIGVKCNMSLVLVSVSAIKGDEG